MRLGDFQPDFNRNFRLPSLIKPWSQVVGAVEDFVGSLSSPRARALFNSALEFVRPHHLAMGLRVARLSTTHVEVVVPSSSRNRQMEGETDPGVVVSAAVMGSELLLRRMDLHSLGDLRLDSLEWNRLEPLNVELRGRLEFSKLAQEALRAGLQQQGSESIELLMFFLDPDEKRRAEVLLKYRCRHANHLAWKETDDHSSERRSE